MTHTPAPWIIDKEGHHINSTVTGIAIACIRDDKEQKANARLIAAAPELLEAASNVHTRLIGILNDLREIANNIAPDNEVIQDKIDSITANGYLEDQIDNLAVVINKARGF